MASSLLLWLILQGPGDPGALEGWSWAAGATTDWSDVLEGGRSRQAALRSRPFVQAEADLQVLFGWEGARLYGEVHGFVGRDGSLDAGDVQAFSNIDHAEDFVDLAELWLSWRFPGLEARAGQMDANRQFAWVEHGLSFLHSSMGYTPVIHGLPTWPEPRPGLTLDWRPSEAWSLRGGAFESASGRAFWIGQADLVWESGRLGGGAFTWRGSGPPAATATSGAFLTLDQWLQRAEDDRGLGFFLQAGESQERPGPVDRHLGGGLSWYGPLSGRPADHLGLGISHVALTPVPGGTETAVELHYRAVLHPALALQPWITWIEDPGGALPDAWILGIRVDLAF